MRLNRIKTIESAIQAVKKVCVMNESQKLAGKLPHWRLRERIDKHIQEEDIVEVVSFGHAGNGNQRAGNRKQ